MSQLNHDQDLLALDLRCRDLAVAWQNPMPSYIVEAPAGAGKTELLTQRYLMLLQTVKHPEEVVAITFTNKAASEMRERILSSLQNAHDGIPPNKPHKVLTDELAKKALDRSAELQWGLLETPSRLRVYTIDALSAQLARQMPLLSRFGTQPEVLQEAERFYQQAASNTLALLEDAKHGNAVYIALGYFDNDNAQLANLLARMLEKRDQWLDYHGSKITIADAEQALLTLVERDIQQANTVLTAKVQQLLMPIARYAASNLPCTEPIALLIDWQQPIANNFSALAMWQAVVDLLCAKDDFRKTWNKNQGIMADEVGRPLRDELKQINEALAQDEHASEILRRLRLLPKPKFGEYAKAMIESLNSLLQVAYEQLWLIFQQHGKVDFVEISQRAIAAFSNEQGTPSALAMRLDYQIQHLLVDEFQDTSPSQIRLIEMLTREWQVDDGRSLFLVGDPMQSIYRFRKANVGLFLRAQQQGIGHIPLTPLQLSQNNRSEPAVVEWINHTFAQVFPAQDSISDGAIQYREFVARKPSSSVSGVTVHALLDVDTKQDATELEDVDDEADDSEVIGEVRLREANVMIKIIQQTRAYNSKAKIAVLVRARNHLQALVSQIRRHHPTLKFQAVEIEELANRQVVQDLLSLCHALHHRADRVHWLAILRAPWCGLKLKSLHTLIGGDRDRTILELMQDTQRLQALDSEERQRLEHVRDVLLQALNQQGRMSTSRWLRSTWLMLNGPHCLWKTSDATDVEAFFERIDSIEREDIFSMAALTREVEKLYAHPDVTDDDTLQFMTIHKSKGLEFDTVIMPGLDLKSGRDDAPLMLWEEVLEQEGTEADVVLAPMVPKSKRNEDNDRKIYDFLKQFEKRRANYENMRVLYVGATRAERCLHLLGAVKPNKDGEIKPKSGTFLAMLWPLIKEDFSEEKLQASLQLGVENIHDQGALQAFVPKLIRLADTKFASEFGDTNVRPNTYQHQTQSSSDSATEQVKGLGVDIGTLTHRYCQLIAEQGMASWTVDKIHSLQAAMQGWFSAKAYSTAMAAQGAETVQSLLSNLLNNPTLNWVLQEHEQAACEYALEQIQTDGSVKRWVIDRTFIYQGERWIVDYKTDALQDGQTPRDLAESYRQQLEQYAALFADEGLAIKLAVVVLSVSELVVLD